MNETIHPEVASDVPWPTSEHRVRVPDTTMRPGSERAAPAGDGLESHATQGAQNTVDRRAGRVAPAAQQPGERIPAVGDAIHATTDLLRDTRDEWMDSVRSTVRGNPLASMAAAVALGAVIARITR